MLRCVFLLLVVALCESLWMQASSEWQKRAVKHQPCPLLVLPLPAVLLLLVNFIRTITFIREFWGLFCPDKFRKMFTAPSLWQWTSLFFRLDWGLPDNVLTHFVAVVCEIGLPSETSLWAPRGNYHNKGSCAHVAGTVVAEIRDSLLYFYHVVAI